MLVGVATGAFVGDRLGRIDGADVGFVVGAGVGE